MDDLKAYYMSAHGANFKIVPRSAVEISVEIKRFTVNRLCINASIRLVDYGEGFHLEGCALWRFDDLSSRVPSRTKKKVIAIMVQLGRDFAERNPERMRHAAMVDLKEELDGFGVKMRRCREEIRQLKDQRALFASFCKRMKGLAYPQLRAAVLKRRSSQHAS